MNTESELLLSVIIPVYNKEKHLEECLESVINQEASSGEYEIISIDDGSTDHSGAIIDAYSKRVGNLKAVHQANGGVSAARNKGIRLARGRYIWYVDADDFISKNAVESLLPVIRDDYYDRIEFRLHNLRLTYREYTADPLSVNKGDSRRTDSVVWSSVYKKQFLISNGLLFREDIAFGEDTLFIYEFNKRNGNQKLIDEALYFYRVNESSVTKSSENEEKLRSHLRCAEIVKQYYDSEGNKELKTVRYLHYELEYVMSLISELPYSKRKEYLSCICSKKLFPFMRASASWLGVYTDIHSFHLRTVCALSGTPVFSWKIILWAKVWNSRLKKKTEKKLKSVIK